MSNAIKYKAKNHSAAHLEENTLKILEIIMKTFKQYLSNNLHHSCIFMCLETTSAQV